MYTQTVVLCLFGLVLMSHGFSDDDKAKIKELILGAGKECAVKIGLTEAEMEAMKGSKKVPDTEKGACFAKCMLESFGVMKDDKYVRQGIIDASAPFVADDAAKLATINSVADKCEKEVTGGANACQLAKEIVECTHKYKDDLGLDIMMM